MLAPAHEGSPLPHLFITEKGSRVTEGTLRRRLYGWVREARLKKADVKPHNLRRTFGTWYLQENPGQLIELAELMVHSNLSQVRKYALEQIGNEYREQRPGSRRTVQFPQARGSNVESIQTQEVTENGDPEQ